jgi:hypothetical protein
LHIGLVGYQCLEVLDSLPKLKSTQSKRTDGVKKRIIYVNGALYYFVVLPETNLFQSAIVFGPIGKTTKDVGFYETKEPLSLDDVLYLTYACQQQNRIWTLWHKLSKPERNTDIAFLTQYQKKWRLHLTNQATSGKDSGEKYSFFHTDTFNYVLGDVRHSANCNVEITDENDEKIIKLDGIPREWRLPDIFRALIERLLLHRFAEPTLYASLHRKLHAMQEGRLRFLTKSKRAYDTDYNLGLYSYGQMVACCDQSEYVWSDPDLLLAEFLPSSICPIIWGYVLDEKRMCTDLNYPLGFTSVRKIEICPNILFENFDAQFEILNRNIYGSNSKTRHVVETVFAPQHKNTPEKVLEVFSSQWQNLPRILEFVHPFYIFQIDRHRADVPLANILLFNRLAGGITEYKNHQRCQQVTPHYHEADHHQFLPYIVFGRGNACTENIVWRFDHIADLGKAFERQYGKMKGVIDETLFMNFVLKNAIFDVANADRMHFTCIRNIRYNQHEVLHHDCPWTEFAIMFQHGLETRYNSCFGWPSTK